MRKPILIAALALSLAPSIVLADPPAWAPAHGRRAKEAEIYDGRGRYVDPRPIGPEERVWRGSDGRYYCRRSNGSTGLVLGAAAGAVIGNQLAGHGDKTLGTVLGAAGGALLGHEIDRSHLRCR